MKVRCEANRIEQLAWWIDLKACVEDRFRYPDGILNLDVGREYVVHGLVLTSLCTWVFVCEDDDGEYPYLYPMPLFSLVDAHIPNHWEMGQATRPFASRHCHVIAVVSYRELATDPAHYGASVDGDARARARFAQHKHTVDVSRLG